MIAIVIVYGHMVMYIQINIYKHILSKKFKKKKKH